MDTPSTPPVGHGLSGYLDERELQIGEDYDWCLRDPEVLRQYPGLFVAAYKKTVWGCGKTIGEAVQDALSKPGCPPREALAKVYIEGAAYGRWGRV